jgi:hypothetical protein
MLLVSLRPTAKRRNPVYRETRMVDLAPKSPRNPELAHVVPIRRCNLPRTHADLDLALPSRSR